MENASKNGGSRKTHENHKLNSANHCRLNENIAQQFTQKSTNRPKIYRTSEHYTIEY